MIAEKNPNQSLWRFYMIPLSNCLFRYMISAKAKKALRATKTIKSNRYVLSVYNEDDDGDEDDGNDDVHDDHADEDGGGEGENDDEVGDDDVIFGASPDY